MKRMVLVFMVAVIAAMLLPAAAMAADTVYGMERGTGTIWQIEPVTGIANPIKTVGPPPAWSSISPNGLAYEPDSGRIYFTQYGEPDGRPSQLYFWDGFQLVDAGPLSGEVAAATISGGRYYYIVGGPSGQRTDDMYVVTFASDGKIVSNSFVKDIAATASLAVRWRRRSRSRRRVDIRLGQL